MLDGGGLIPFNLEANLIRGRLGGRVCLGILETRKQSYSCRDLNPGPSSPYACRFDISRITERFI